MPRQIVPPTILPKSRWRIAPLLLTVVLAVLFWRGFLPDYVHFSNDTPLGQQNVDWVKLPSAMFGDWDDLNAVGFSGGSYSANISAALSLLLGPVGYAKFLAPAALFIVGLGAWFFFRQLKLSPLAATLGALAAMLNSIFFSDACWGVASHEIALGMDFVALGLVMANTPETRLLVRWVRLALAGFCVGMNVMEAADIGALYSVFIAAFVFYKSIWVDTEGNVIQKMVRGFSRVAVIAACAGFIALQSIVGLVGTQIQGIAGTAQDTETKAAHWDFVTQWSLPKMETLGLVVPGVFGYKMDTPQNMMPMFQDMYRGGVYWGGMGRDPAVDRFFDSGGTGSPPPGIMRFSGGGNYCGILVALIAAWTIAQSFRRQNSVFSGMQKKIIWFWVGVLLVSLPLAWGRFAPFYALPYQLPYFSTIRNPAKFFIFFSWAMVILFGFGVHALSRRCMEIAATKSSGFLAQLKSWWAKAGVFDRRWSYCCAGVFGASVLGCFIYASEKPALVRYIQARGYPDEEFAQQIIAFSVGQVAWWLMIFAAALMLLTLVLAGCFAGPRAKIGGVLLCALLVFDLGRANLPYIIHWDYKQKYEVGSLNPIEKNLRNKPYEHRVAGLPFSAPQGLELLDQVYRIEWMQQHFPYYNIQCLDIIQMPRMPEDLKSYLETLHPHSMTDVPLYTRHWQLTNTRYLLGVAGFLDAMNQQLDPVQHRFRIAQRFDIVPKPGVAQATQLEELTAVPNENGPYALFEFTGALPRAKLYSNWRVNTNDQANLNTLADLNFNPEKTVLISTPQKDFPAMATNENSGTVEFKSYSPKQIVLTADSPVPAVLLLNDKYDPTGT